MIKASLETTTSLFLGKSLDETSLAMGGGRHLPGVGMVTALTFQSGLHPSPSIEHLGTQEPTIRKSKEIAIPQEPRSKLVGV
ncbi:hypothetical protein PV08_07682 [Exophiala spinifera]|uniref:Uncharacterized protein n=1 Tax=Exophiala spinifera TaxID=91928 RepID=A0A0D1ZQ12_9EURO|nr:uncharacterized protein PV08_07682 [Exophiala spinifera]KIW14897.1 hypothetical protein PV08_07682 [Exophiala spinifera]